MYPSTLELPFLYVSLIWGPVEKPSFHNNICITDTNHDLPDLLKEYIRSGSCKVVLAKGYIVQNLNVKIQLYLLKSKLTVKGMNI